MGAGCCTGSGRLGLRLENADGTLIEQHEVPASARLGSWELGTRTDTGDWVGVSLDAPHTLEDGRTYCLRLMAPEGTRTTV